jgi:hypothetical protein
MFGIVLLVVIVAGIAWTAFGGFSGCGMGGYGPTSIFRFGR